VKSYDETSVSSSESLIDLKRELARYKETESHTASYISALEVRLTKSDESVLSLQQTIVQLESESEKRTQEVAALQARLEHLEQDGASWRTDLEGREIKVKDLELKMEEWERKKKEANEDRVRLSGMVGEVEQAKRSLQDLNRSDGSSSSGVSTPASVDLSVENQLIALQQTHAATLADLSTVTAKYRDALQEIADLAAQVEEVNLANPTIPELSALESLETTPARRKMMSLRSKEVTADLQFDSSARKPFFRQAISLDSLHGRYYPVSCSCPAVLTHLP
jgi:chromosome segregation ATPase